MIFGRLKKKTREKIIRGTMLGFIIIFMLSVVGFLVVGLTTPTPTPNQQATPPAAATR